LAEYQVFSFALRYRPPGEFEELFAAGVLQ
jgi:hypothetical protein